MRSDLWNPKLGRAGPASFLGAPKLRASVTEKCYGLNASPTFTGYVLTPAPQNVTVFGDMALKEVNTLK